MAESKLVKFDLPEEDSPKSISKLKERRTQTPEPAKLTIPDDESSIQALEHEL